MKKHRKDIVIDVAINDGSYDTHKVLFDGKDLLAGSHSPEDFERQVILRGLGDGSVCSCINTILTAREMLKQLEDDILGVVEKPVTIAVVHNKTLFSLIQQVSSLTSYSLLAFDFTGGELSIAAAPLCYWPMSSEEKSPIVNIGKYIDDTVPDTLGELTNALFEAVIQPLHDTLVEAASGSDEGEVEILNDVNVACNVYIVLPAARVFVQSSVYRMGSVSVELDSKKLDSALHERLRSSTTISAAGVEKVYMDYSGCGDSGQTENLADEESNALVSLGLEESLDDSVRCWVENNVLEYDWENNEGGNGVVTIDLATGAVTASAFSNVEEAFPQPGSAFDIRP
jgi:hypothetical protein